MARPQPGLGLARGGAYGGGRGARREQSTSRLPSHPWELAVAVQLAERPAAATKSSRCSAAWASVATTKLEPANVEWTRCRSMRRFAAGVARPAAREVLGPMHELARGKPWFPLGEAMLLGRRRAITGRARAYSTRSSPIPSPRCRAYVLATAWSPRRRCHVGARGANRGGSGRAPRAAATCSIGGPGTAATRSTPAPPARARSRRRTTATSPRREREVARLVAGGLTNRGIAKACLHLAAHGRGPRVEHPGQAWG